ncbi:MAG: hypothetical protein QG597_4897 [Actinomycetota bacterium]|nr:hypothetical protein [Actinomycetota bacterium]
MDWVFDGAFDWLARRLVELLTWLLEFMTSTFFTSPDVTGLPQVAAIAQRSAVVVGALFTLMIIVAGAVGMTYGGFQIQYEVKDLLPRLIVAFLLSAFGLSLCQALIDVFNAITAALVGQTAAGPHSVHFVRNTIEQVGVNPAIRVVISLNGLLIVVLFLQLMFSVFTRLTILLILAGTAPVALACIGLPQTQPVAALWWRSLIGVLVTPLLQGVAFSIGVDLLITPGYNLSGLLGFSAVRGAGVLETMDMLLLTCLLLVTVRIPRMVARHVLNGSGQGGGVGVIVRAVVVQTVLRKIPIPGLSRLVR